MEDLRAILPSYQQTKIIHGAKILEIAEDVDGYWLTLDTNELRGIITPRVDPTKHDLEYEAKYNPGGKHYNEACHKTKVDFTWHSKHSPVVGGYFVLYPDGYTSFSPAKPFEAGNVLLEIDWNNVTEDQVLHMFFQLRHNLNTIRWGHQHLDKVLEALLEPKPGPHEQKGRRVWVAGKSLLNQLQKVGIGHGRNARRNGDSVFIDIDALYIPHDILIRAEFAGQMLVSHSASWVVIEE
jgi:hypothetical protein